MIRDGLRHFQVGRGGENDFAPGFFFGAQPSEELFVDGQGGGVHRDARGELLFQEGATAHPPQQN